MEKRFQKAGSRTTDMVKIFVIRKRIEREKERGGGALGKFAFGQWLLADSFGQKCIVMPSSTLGPN